MITEVGDYARAVNDRHNERVDQWEEAGYVPPGEITEFRLFNEDFDRRIKPLKDWAEGVSTGEIEAPPEYLEPCRRLYAEWARMILVLNRANGVHKNIFENTDAEVERGLYEAEMFLARQGSTGVRPSK